MTTIDPTEIFLVAVPGLELALQAEAKSLRFKGAQPIRGGVLISGGWPEVWRANYELRGASRVLVRFASFRVFHLAQLDKRARKVAWGGVLRRDRPFRVEVTCKTSRIYHSGAAAERIERAIAEELGARPASEADVIVKARIESDLCTIGVDTSGEPLHRRGHKEEVNKAPLRETLASLFLRQCGYTGSEPVVDPMCGSGTFVIEAAEMALGLKPGRSRPFAFEQLATFDEAAFAAIKAAGAPRPKPEFRFYGSDWDRGAVRMSRANAERAGVADLTTFTDAAIDDLAAPAGPPGLVMVNPPYGDRIGDKGRLEALYAKLGQVLAARFSGWRVGLVTNEAKLAAATKLPFEPPGTPVSHGGLSVVLYRTGPLP